MNQETATKAIEDRAPVTYNGMTGRLAGLETDGETILAHFVRSDNGIGPWVDILDVELSAAIEHFPQISMRELVEQLVIAEVELERWNRLAGTGSETLNGRYRETRDAARTEIGRRLDAIQMYVGTEATIIKLILSGQKSGS